MNWLKLAKEVIVAFVIAGVVLLLIGLMLDDEQAKASPHPCRVLVLTTWVDTWCD